MRTFSQPAAMRRWSERARATGRLAFVPTMGGLHEGHLALVRAARRRVDQVAVSIFVNPMQFGPGEDYRRYPRDVARDRQLLRALGVDAVFTPTAEAMYPAGFATAVDVGGLATGLCGRFRPGHFRGVATVVAKLFNVVRPHVAVFGQKDAQQVAVIRRMARDLDFGIEIVVVPTMRDGDGLAMSSRNRNLSPAERREAPVLAEALELARRLVREGELSVPRLRRRMLALVHRRTHARVQYLEFVDADRLEPVSQVSGRVLVAVAAFFGKTRLIDNVILVGGSELRQDGRLHVDA